MATQTRLKPTILIELSRLKRKANLELTPSPSSRRSKMEIMANILDFCKSYGKTKTGIMYNANSNYAQLTNHLNHLTAADLLLKNDSSKYKTTQKGLHFLKLFTELKNLTLSDEQ